ncbi:MAG: hypothetical protein AAF411_29285, partial [Myxococcota bacterium]
GVIPFTHHFHFGPGGALRVDDVGSAALAFDVARAGLVGFVLVALRFLLFGAAFASLAAAFCKLERDEEEDAQSPLPLVVPASKDAARRIAWRIVLYRSWLAPMVGLFGLPVSLAAYLLPESAAMLYAIFAALPLLLFLLNFQAAARQSAGCSTGGALLCTLVPLALSIMAEVLLIGSTPGSGLLAPFLPTPS